MDKRRVGEQVDKGMSRFLKLKKCSNLFYKKIKIRVHAKMYILYVYNETFIESVRNLKEL